MVATAPGGPVTPKLVFWGNSLVNPMIPRTTKAARMNARSVDVATLRRVLRIGGSCLPAKSLRSEPSSPLAEPPGEPPAPSSFS